jgi:branched-chain amino acid aminotransferase
MLAALDINVTKVERSKLNDLNPENLPFGKYFTDHMLEADFENGKWTNVEIKPYQPLLLEPSLSALHYGQAIFEGIKAYKDETNNAYIFRPYDNFNRFNISAARMCMPTVPEEIFIEGMKQLIDLDKSWIPNKKDHSLYIRPFMFSTDCMLGVKPSGTYKFVIILSPTGPYFAAPMKIFVEEKYTRAAPGGVGFAKNAGNYGGSLIAAEEAKKLGYDQVLWTDAFEHKWLQEVGMMNVFFMIDGKAITPSLDEGTILDGVTRKTLVTLLKEELGITVEERRISIDELIEAFNKELVTEAFGSGTAATVALIKELRYKDTVLQFDLNKATVAVDLKKHLDKIRSCAIEDKRGWMVKI